MTRDTDFVSLISVAHSIMSCDKFFPHNEEFYKAILENPFEFYIQDKQDPEAYHCPFANNPVCSKKGITPRDIYLERAIRHLWKKYSRISERTTPEISVVDLDINEIVC